MQVQNRHKWRPPYTGYGKEIIMARITLQWQQQEIAQYELTDKESVSVGRSPENDIVIDNMAVSGKHARIIADETGFIIEDAGSWNGTFIDGKPIDSRRLSDGDKVTIGKHVLLYSDRTPSSHPEGVLNKQNAAVPTPSSNAADATVFLDTQKQKAMMDQYDRSGHKTSLLVVKYKEKILYKHLLKNNTTTIGRDPGNQVIIDNPAVSSQHAAIAADKDGFTISDLNSTNGTFVNKNPITTCRLHNGDMITIGRHDLVFEQTGTYTCEELAQPFVQHSALNASKETFYLNPGEYQAMVAGSTPHDGKSIPGFAFLKGGKGYAPVQNGRFQIGKADTCDIVVKGLAIGNTAAIVTQKADGCYLTYQSGLSKPMVNGQKIKDTIKLNSGDIIEIGSVKLEFRA